MTKEALNEHLLHDEKHLQKMADNMVTNMQTQHTALPVTMTSPASSMVTSDFFAMGLGQFFCDICISDISGESNYKSHIIGQKHKKELRRRALTQAQPYFCPRCKIDLGSANALNEHLMQRTHLDRPGKTMTQSSSSACLSSMASITTENDKRICGVCQVPVPSGNTEEHSQGKLHLNNLAKQGLSRGTPRNNQLTQHSPMNPTTSIQSNVVSSNTGPSMTVSLGSSTKVPFPGDYDKKLCPDCNVPVPSGNIEEHNKGKAHQANVIKNASFNAMDNSLRTLQLGSTPMAPLDNLPMSDTNAASNYGAIGQPERNLLGLQGLELNSTNSSGPLDFLNCLVKSTISSIPGKPAAKPGSTSILAPQTFDPFAPRHTNPWGFTNWRQ